MSGVVCGTLGEVIVYVSPWKRNLATSYNPNTKEAETGGDPWSSLEPTLSNSQVYYFYFCVYMSWKHHFSGRCYVLWGQKHEGSSE